MTPAMTTIATYTGPDPAVKDAFLQIESFIGDMENAELTDGSTVYCEDVVEALNVLIARLNPST